MHAVGLPASPAAMLCGGFGVRRVHRSGVLPQRALIIGSRSLLRERGSRRALAGLVEDIADRIWLSTRRGLDCDVLWELGHGIRTVLKDLAAFRVWRYDLVVLLMPSGVRRSSRMAMHLQRLTTAIQRQVSPSSRFLPVAVRHPSAPLDPASSVGFSPATAAAIVDGLRIPPLDVSRRAREEQTVREDAGRDEAVDVLQLRDRPHDEFLQRVVDQAGDRFQTRFAELNVVGRDVQWSLAAAGLPRGSRPKEGSLCDAAIQRSGPTIIQDTLQEMPVETIPRLPDGRLVRFYAGHPIQSIHGHRIGVLCVYDTRPHQLRYEDSSALRDLALLAEARLIGI